MDPLVFTVLRELLVAISRPTAAVMSDMAGLPLGVAMLCDYRIASQDARIDFGVAGLQGAFVAEALSSCVGTQGTFQRKTCQHVKPNLTENVVFRERFPARVVDPESLDYQLRSVKC